MEVGVGEGVGLGLLISKNRKKTEYSIYYFGYNLQIMIVKKTNIENGVKILMSCPEVLCEFIISLE